MSSFSGFPSGKVRLIPIPVQFFTDLLPEINNLAEYKVILYTLWFLNNQEGPIRYITRQDIANDKMMMKGLGKTQEAAQMALTEGIEHATQRGTLLKVQIELSDSERAIYFLNTPRSQAAIEALKHGDWSPDQTTRATISLKMERPNIFRLYEENIGALTPMIADTLRDAEEIYKTEWIEDAIRIAVENNARSWRYIDAILRSWQEKGRNGAYRKDTKEDRLKYIQGEYGEFGEF